MQNDARRSIVPWVAKDFDAQEISRMWEIFQVRPGQTLELRGIWPKTSEIPRRPINRHFSVPDHDSILPSQQEFQKIALELNHQGFNTYVVMNPVRGNFTGNAAKDTDITSRRLMLVDIDRKINKSNPATVHELQLALCIALAIKEFLSQLGWVEPMMVMSGNGYHLYYRLPELPNTIETTHLIERALKNLARKFNTDLIEVDTSVFNASRITKIPGTIARKGMSSSDRPYRQAVII